MGGRWLKAASQSNLHSNFVSGIHSSTTLELAVDLRLSSPSLPDPHPSFSCSSSSSTHATSTSSSSSLFLQSSHLFNFATFSFFFLIHPLSLYLHLFYTLSIPSPLHFLTLSPLVIPYLYPSSLTPVLSLSSLFLYSHLSLPLTPIPRPPFFCNLIPCSFCSYPSSYSLSSCAPSLLCTCSQRASVS